MDEKNKGEGCCSSTSGQGGCCGGGKKFVVGLLLGALLFAAGFAMAKYVCHSKQPMMCPVSGQMMQK